jgi:hypothetical protein
MAISAGLRLGLPAVRRLVSAGPAARVVSESTRQFEAPPPCPPAHGHIGCAADPWLQCAVAQVAAAWLRSARMAVQASYKPYVVPRPAPAAQFARNGALKVVIVPAKVEEEEACEVESWDRTRALVVWRPAHPHIAQLAQVCDACLVAARVCTCDMRGDAIGSFAVPQCRTPLSQHMPVPRPAL